jgi:uncharacterized protein (DUF952 family)
MIILHICTIDAWQNAQAAGSYQGDTLASEGFIHCSTPQQIVTVANRFYRGQQGLCLLLIDRARVQAPVRDENLEGGESLFPHIYGPLNLNAVVDVRPFEPRADGSFAPPAI